MTRLNDLFRETRPLMSWINLGEVAYVVERRAGADASRDVVRQLRDHVALDLPSPEMILLAASIKANHPLAFADAFAVATSVTNRATLLTGDPEILNGKWEVEDLRSTR